MITRVHHVGVVVPQLAGAYGFWRDALGLVLVREAEVEEQGVRAALLGAGPCGVELLEPIRPDTGVARFLATRGPGLHHLCFESDDVGRELQRLWATGVDVLDARPRPGLVGLVAFLHPRACAGVLVELTTPAERPALPPAPLRVVAVHVSAEDVGATVRRYQDLFGLAPVPTGATGVAQLAAGEAVVQVNPAARTGARAGLSALRGAVDDPAALGARLVARGVPSRPWPHGIVVEPAHATGVALIVHGPEPLRPAAGAPGGRGGQG